MKVGFVSLGCSKNLIDTEIAIGHFKNNNYEIENNPEKAAFPDSIFYSQLAQTTNLPTGQAGLKPK